LASTGASQQASEAVTGAVEPKLAADLPGQAPRL